MINNRNLSRVIAAILSIVLLLALLAPNSMVLTANAVAYSDGSTDNDVSKKQQVPLTNGANQLMEDINATGDTPTEEENRGWCVLIDVTSSVNDGFRQEGDVLIRELQKQYPKIDILPFTYRLMLGQPYYEGMLMEGFSTDIAASYMEAAREYDHLIIISDFVQSDGRCLELGLQQHQDVWLYQLGEEDGRAEYFAENLARKMQSDCSLRLYCKDGVKEPPYKDDFPYACDSQQESAIVPVPTQVSGVQEAETSDADKVVVVVSDDTDTFSMGDLMGYIVIILAMIGIYCLVSQGITAWRYRRPNGADGAICYSGDGKVVEVGGNSTHGVPAGVNINFSNVGNGGGNMMGCGRCCEGCGKNCKGRFHDDNKSAQDKEVEAAT